MHVNDNQEIEPRTSGLRYAYRRLDMLATALIIWSERPKKSTYYISKSLERKKKYAN